MRKGEGECALVSGDTAADNGQEAEEEEDLLLYGDSNDKTFSSRSSNPSGQVSGNKDQPSTRREQEALAANAANQPQRGGKKRNNSNNSSTSKAKSDIWNMEESEERKRVKEFWLSLSEESRNALIRLEKEAVLRKMKEQQKHTCTCSVCGRRRTAIEEELEMLYDAYYEELERYTEKQGTILWHACFSRIDGTPKLALLLPNSPHTPLLYAGTKS